MRLKPIAAWLLSVAVAGAGGYGLARSTDSGPAPADSAILSRLERQEALLTALRAQVGALDQHVSALSGPSLAAPAPGAVAASVAPAPVAPAAAPDGSEAGASAKKHDEATPEALALVDRGSELVDRAVSVRHWRGEDAVALRALLPRMPREPRDKLLGRLITALNEGRLTLDEGGPPF